MTPSSRGASDRREPGIHNPVGAISAGLVGGFRNDGELYFSASATLV
jgi:hypothetical protein